jgi:hypothetical protein
MKDLEFVAAQNMTRTDIAVMFNLPPNKLGGSSGDSLDVRDGRDEPDRGRGRRDRADREDDRDAVSQDPSILPQNVMSAEFVLEAMMRADAKSRASSTRSRREWAITPDEIRKRENMPALTAAQKRELKPPAPAPPAPGGLGLVAGADAPVVNGNGNGAMPATT